MGVKHNAYASTAPFHQYRDDNNYEKKNINVKKERDQHHPMAKQAKKVRKSSEPHMTMVEKLYEVFKDQQEVMEGVQASATGVHHHPVRKRRMLHEDAIAYQCEDSSELNSIEISTFSSAIESDKAQYKDAVKRSQPKCTFKDSRNCDSDSDTLVLERISPAACDSTSITSTPTTEACPTHFRNSSIELEPAFTLDSLSPPSCPVDSLPSIGITRLSNMCLDSIDLTATVVHKKSTNNTHPPSHSNCPKVENDFNEDSINMTTSYVTLPWMEIPHLPDTIFPLSSYSPSLDRKQLIRDKKAVEEDRKLLTSPVDEDENTALHLSISKQDEDEALRIISKATAFDELNSSNVYGQTPLHCAVLSGQAKIVRRLMAAGALVMARDGSGDTPLHLASRSGRVDIVVHLTTPIAYEETLDNDYYLPVQAIPQDLRMYNDNNKTCGDVAWDSGHWQVVAILEDLES